MSTTLKRTLYRLFIRQANKMRKDDLKICCSMPIDKEAWLMNGGNHAWVSPYPKYCLESLKSLVPWVNASGISSDGSFDSDQLRSLARQAFRESSSEVPPSVQMNRALDALRILEEQMYMGKCSSSTITNDIRIDVTSTYVGVRIDENISWMSRVLLCL